MKCGECKWTELDLDGRAYCDELCNWGWESFYIDEHSDELCQFEQAIQQRDALNAKEDGE
jgi:hypothetical protein